MNEEVVSNSTIIEELMTIAGNKLFRSCNWR